MALAAIVDNAELGAVLVIACGVNDDLDAVMADIIFQRRRRCPAITAGIGDAVDDAEEIDGVGGRAPEEDEGDEAGAGVLPCDVVGDADGDFGGGARSGDGVATRLFRDVGFVLAAGSLGADEGCQACRDGEGEDRGKHLSSASDVRVFGFTCS